MPEHDLDATLEDVLKIDRVVRQLDESIRLPAFELLAHMFLGKAATNERQIRAREQLQAYGIQVLKSLERFAAQYGNKTKPAHNVLVLAAWCHLHHCPEPLTPQKLRMLANCCGLPLPRRPDCTLRYTSQNRHPLFRLQAPGWQLTDQGQAYVNQNFTLSQETN